MEDGLTIVFAVLVLLVALAGGLAFGAILLRAAVSLSNLIADRLNSPVVVPEPPFLRAMGIVFVTGILHAFVEVVVVLISRGFETQSGAHGFPLHASAAHLLWALLASAPLSAGLLAVFLRASYGRGLLVFVCLALIAGIIRGLVTLGVLVLSGN